MFNETLLKSTKVQEIEAIVMTMGRLNRVPRESEPYWTVVSTTRFQAKLEAGPR